MFQFLRELNILRRIKEAALSVIQSIEGENQAGQKYQKFNGVSNGYQH